MRKYCYVLYKLEATNRASLIGLLLIIKMNSQSNSRVFRRFFKQVSPRRDLVMATREAPMTLDTFIQFQWKRARKYQQD